MIRRRLTAAALCLSFIAPAPALAQDAAGTGLGSSSTTTTTVLNIATLVGIVYAVITTINGGKSAELWRDYLDRNRAEVVAGLSVGAGPAVDDLVMIFDVDRSERRAFGRLLRRERAALLGHLAAEHLSDADARRFALHVVRQLRHDPALSSTAARHATRAL